MKKNKIIRDFNKAAENYEKHANLQFEICQSLFKKSENFILPSSYVLDAGCGTGFFKKFINNDAKIIQADIAFAMCQNARNNFTINADIAEIPIKDNSIDLVFSSLTLQWVTALVQCIDELYRILKPGGKIFIATLLDGTLDELKESYKSLHMRAPVNQFNSPELLNSYIENAGFKKINFVKERKVVNYHNLKELLNSIRKIGANYKDESPIFRGKKFFNDLETIYKSSYSSHGEIKATWNIGYIEAEK